QLYPAEAYPYETKTVDRLLYPTQEPSPNEVPQAIEEQYGDAVELVRDDTQVSDENLEQYLELNDLEHRTTVIDFQDLEQEHPERLEEERDYIVNQLTAFFRE
ncbi:MAG: hypothetical protein SVU32_00665, partial [Candidatus Nanohaloarchaea archaeon]|nr:hypothetical protein [Candidatus Nanohaloarchaea archaeon]